ncbi:uncharacterized protein CEXT_428951 [Caerostris extrusa]|uniref:Uncharacterized protein n=1 Tax=Caerostris extrusa TaxID=172846 RepID=A0AAV4RPT1_CAEEX|nr:uncharacterized protein CEXT_428951 [Caerostris extrusa]
MDERNIRFNYDYIPTYIRLDVSPEDSFNIGKHFGSLTTHNLILPRPNEIRTLHLPHANDKMIDRMPWLNRQMHLQGRMDHELWKSLQNRESRLQPRASGHA